MTGFLIYSCYQIIRAVVKVRYFRITNSATFRSLSQPIIQIKDLCTCDKWTYSFYSFEAKSSST